MEEPTLKRVFGESYESYRRDVGRWAPKRFDVLARRGDKHDVDAHLPDDRS